MLVVGLIEFLLGKSCSLRRKIAICHWGFHLFMVFITRFEEVRIVFELDLSFSCVVGVIDIWVVD